jgi:hypothetical protein
MQDIPINWWAVLAVVALKFVLGFVWFGLLFGKQWQALSGLTEAQMKAGMPKAIVTDVAMNFVMAWVLVHAVRYAGATTWPMGAGVGFFNWLGFVGALSLSGTVYGNRSLKLWALQNAYECIALVAMGAILAVWS